MTVAAGTDSTNATRGGLAIVLFQIVARASALGFVVIASRRLGPDEFSRYTIVAAIVLVAGFLADFGTTAAITRAVSRDRSEADRILSGTLVGSLVLGVTAYALAVGYAVVAYDSAAVADVALGGLAIPFTAVGSSLLGALDGWGRISTRASLNALQTMLATAGGAVVVLAGGGAGGAIAMLAGAPAAVLLVAVLVTRRLGIWLSGFRADWSGCRELLRVAIPFALSGGVTALTMRIDVLLLSLLSSRAETASYDLAVRSVEATTFLSAAIAGPSLYLLSARLGSGDVEGARRAFHEALRMVQLVALPIAVLLVVLADDLTRLAFGPSFPRAGDAVAVLGVFVALQFVVAVQGALNMAGDRLAAGVRRAAFSLVVMVALDLVLIPSSGAVGAAVATVASTALLSVLLGRLQAGDGFPTVLPSFGVLASAGAMAVVTVAARGFGPLAAGTAGLAAYGMTLVVTGTVTFRDARRLVAIAGGRRSQAGTDSVTASPV